MPAFSFCKYHGAGNDFILINNIDNSFIVDNQLIRSLCLRRTGIGADGLILINKQTERGIDFEMQYFNADGYEGSMCGNGGRCAVAFAKKINLIASKTVFKGIDGLHKGTILSEKENLSMVEIQMKDVHDITSFEGGYVMDTGSPHVVKFVKNIEKTDLLTEGKRIRHHAFFPKGTNVNFVEIKDKSIFIRTYERGVEDETLSCGTGVTASAIAYAIKENVSSPIEMNARGGNFCLSFERTKDNNFKNIFLQGPVCFAFEGVFNV